MLPAIESLDPRQMFAAGAVDGSFGKHGVAEVSYALPREQSVAAYQALVDRAGRTYVVAEVTGGATILPQSYQIQRLTAAGAVDPGWPAAKHGRLKFDWSKHTVLIGNPFDVVIETDSRFRVAIDDSDRLVVLYGNTLYRYRPDGSLDKTFGHGGAVALNGFQYTNDVAVDSKNRILVAGTVSVGGSSRMAVARIDPRGRFDRRFGQKGFYAAPGFGALIEDSGGDKGYSVRDAYGQYLRRLADGSIMLAGDGKVVFHDTDHGSDANGQTFETTACKPSSSIPAADPTRTTARPAWPNRTVSTGWFRTTTSPAA